MSLNHSISEASYENENLERFCLLCLKDYNVNSRKPLIIPNCGHTFCFPCIDKIMKKSPKRKSILCPKCQKETDNLN